MSAIHGVKIYNLSSGKTLPQWLNDKQKRALSKDDGYRRRIELLQDFEFPTASQTIKMSPDGQFVIVTGTYPPQVKVYEVAELSMKFERHLDAECVAMEVLSAGFEKLVFLQADRTLAFHAAYGMHHAVRIPRFGRDLAYQQAACDLIVGGAGPELYRLNLDEGRYRAPLTLPGDGGTNKLALSSVHQLLGAGTDDGWVHMFDTRAGGRGKAPVASLRVGGGGAETEVTALAFAPDGLTLGVGTSAAQCLLYDLRSSDPLLTKDHQYGLPVTDVKFHSGGGAGGGGARGGAVLSSDAKIVKAWDRADGAVLANVEAPANVNGVCVAHDARGDSGLLMLAGEQARVMAYYIPTLGPAPRWCSFLDSLTEELEEGDAATVYDDYKFVTRDEVEALGIASLVGTPLLRGYMHGFFMAAQLHNRLRAVSEPFAYEAYRRAKLRERVEEKRKSRIALRRALPAVNRPLAEKLLAKRGGAAAAADADAAAASNPLGDDRFAQMFQSRDFEVDDTSAEFLRHHPSGAPGGGRGRRGGARESDSDDLDSGAEDAALLGDRFTRVGADDDDSDGGGFSDSGDDDGDNMEMPRRDASAAAARRSLGGGGGTATPKAKAAGAKRPKTAPAARAKPKFFELNEGEDTSAVLALGGERDRAQARERAQQRLLPLEDRLHEMTQEERRVGRDRVVNTSAGLVREFTFTPKSGRGGRGGGGHSSGGGGGRSGGGGGRGGGRQQQRSGSAGKRKRG